MGGEAKGLWGVLAAESIWDRMGKGRAEWPTLAELKRGGRNGLPVPRTSARDGRLGREVRLRGLDRVGFGLVMDPETVRFNEEVEFMKEEVMRYCLEAIEMES